MFATLVACTASTPCVTRSLALLFCAVPCPAPTAWNDHTRLRCGRRSWFAFLLYSNIRLVAGCAGVASPLLFLPDVRRLSLLRCVTPTGRRMSERTTSLPRRATPTDIVRTGTGSYLRRQLSSALYVARQYRRRTVYGGVRAGLVFLLSLRTAPRL